MCSETPFLSSLINSRHNCRLAERDYVAMTFPATRRSSAFIPRVTNDSDDVYYISGTSADGFEPSGGEDDPVEPVLRPPPEITRDSFSSTAGGAPL